MAILDILVFPDPRLRKIAKPIDAVTDEIRQLASDMFETMYDAPGVGLAATQVDVHKRIIVVDVSEDQSGAMALINPEILDMEGDSLEQEGCLSIPGFYESVERAEHVRVRALNLDGESFEVEADGLLAICLQHEIDHLDGKQFIDYLSPLKQQRIRKKLEKSRRKVK